MSKYVRIFAAATLALAGEELLTVLLIGVRLGLAARAATGEQQRERPKERQGLPHYAGGTLPVVPSFAIASSRVG